MVLAIQRQLKNKQRNRDPITTEEYRNATKAIMCIVQHERFSEELKAFVQNKKMKRNSSVIKLNPFDDKNGILRVGGRLINAELDDDAKHQILIPYKHFVTDLIIKKAHLDCMHGGAMLTEAIVRQQFWIPKGYRRIKAMIHN